MASWRKFKDINGGKEVKLRPISDTIYLENMKQLGIGIEISGNEVVLNAEQIKNLICYLINLN